MKKILLAVDDTKSSINIIDTMSEIFCTCMPREVVLLYVQKMISGKSVMDDLVVSASEWETLKDSLADTAYQEIKEKKAQKVIDYFSGILRKKGITGIIPVVREGHAAEEILKVSQEEEVDMIIMGCRSSRLHNLFMGSVSREVINNTEKSVLLVK
ncbi:MAG: universal stress protein [Desulfobulbaceae bacterium]|nr:universal stress protein [Desulfobulbaceae bacterium]